MAYESDSVGKAIREARAFRDGLLDIESEDDSLFYGPFYEPPPSYPDSPVMRNQAVDALSKAMDKEWLSSSEQRRVMAAFQEALEETLQSSLGEARLRDLGKKEKPKHAVKRKTRRTGSPRQEDLPKF